MSSATCPLSYFGFRLLKWAAATNRFSLSRRCGSNCLLFSGPFLPESLASPEVEISSTSRTPMKPPVTSYVILGIPELEPEPGAGVEGGAEDGVEGLDTPTGPGPAGVSVCC